MASQTTMAMASATATETTHIEMAAAIAGSLVDKMRLRNASLFGFDGDDDEGYDKI